MGFDGTGTTTTTTASVRWMVVMIVPIVDARSDCAAIVVVAVDAGRCHGGGCRPTDYDRRRGGHKQPEAAGVKAGPVAVHQDHCGGEVESTCGQDAVRGFAVERLAGHQSSGVVVVAWWVGTKGLKPLPASVNEYFDNSR